MNLYTTFATRNLAHVVRMPNTYSGYPRVLYCTGFISGELSLCSTRVDTLITQPRFPMCFVRAKRLLLVGKTRGRVISNAISFNMTIKET